MKEESACDEPSLKKSGRWKNNHGMLKMRLDVSALCLICSFGRANPLRPSSSLLKRTEKIKSNTMLISISAVPENSGNFDEKSGAADIPNRLFRATAAALTTARPKIANAYHLNPTRTIHSFLNRERIPSRPELSPVMITAAKPTIRK